MGGSVGEKGTSWDGFSIQDCCWSCIGGPWTMGWTFTAIFGEYDASSVLREEVDGFGNASLASPRAIL